MTEIVASSTTTTAAAAPTSGSNSSSDNSASSSNDSASATTKSFCAACNKVYLVALVLFFAMCIFSGDLFWIVISFFLVLNATSAFEVSQQQQQQQNQQVNSNSATDGHDAVVSGAGAVRVLPADPHLVSGNGPVAGSPETYPSRHMVVRLGNGQVFHVPLPSSAAENMRSPREQSVEITDLQTGDVIHTLATAAVPILTSDGVLGTWAAAGVSPLPTSAESASTTWMQDYEAAKYRDGAEDEADALYGEGVAYDAQPHATDTAVDTITTAVEICAELDEDVDTSSTSTLDDGLTDFEGTPHLHTKRDEDW